MNAHIDEVVAWKRENPADDLLTAMIAAEEGTGEATEARFRHFTLSASHRPVTGAIDELRILNYARTPDEIAADASATAPFETPAAQQTAEWVPGMPEPD